MSNMSDNSILATQARLQLYIELCLELHPELEDDVNNYARYLLETYGYPQQKIRQECAEMLRRKIHDTNIQSTEGN